MTAYPYQPTASDIHVEGTSTKHHVLYPGSIGEQIKLTIIDELQKYWQEAEFELADFPIVEIEHPADLAHGDWSCNVAMQLAKPLKQNPFAIATELVNRLNKHDWNDKVAKIEVIKPGFINFYLSNSWLAAQIDAILQAKADFGRTAIRADKKIMIEHTQPNSHKQVHIGHLRNTFLGMAAVFIHRALGFEVISATYGGDVGPHVAKCLWALRDVDLNQYNTTAAKATAIQEAYIRGTQAAVSDPAVDEEVKKINKALYDKSDPKLIKLWHQTFAWSVEAQKEIYARIGSHFDRYYWESEVWQVGLETVKKYIGTVFEQSEGAVIFDGEKYGLHKRVFITSQGTAPYEAKDLGLQQLKVQEYNLDFGIIQTGNDQADYFQVVLKALELIFPELKDVFLNVTYGMVNVPSGKMSSREGNVILAIDVLDEMHDRAYTEVTSRYPEMEEEQKNEIAETIALGATKYAMLKYDPKQDISFDPDTTLSFSGDSGPYLQYVCVRISSMLAKAGEQDLTPTPANNDLNQWTDNLTNEELTLLRKLYQLPEITIRSALEYKINYLCTYLFDLAQAYNDFYLACPVLKADKPVAMARLALSQATLQILTNGLKMLGISVPEKM